MVGFVEVPGGRVEVLDLAAGPGADDRPPLVLLHEGLGCVALWRDVPGLLRAATGGRRTVVYSRLGYGRSDPVSLPRPTTYMHDEADVVLPVLMAALGIDAPVLVGHSDGASIALLHAGAGHPVSRLVLYAPHVFVEPQSIAGIEAARAAYATTDLRERLARHHANVDVAFRGWNDAWLSEEFRTWNIEDRLAVIEAPVLVVQGDDDDYGTVAQLDAIEAGVSGPTERLWLHDVGHAPHFDAKERVVAATAAFVDAP